MKPFVFIAAAALALAGLCHAQAPVPPARLTLPPALSAAGTSTTVGGAPWGYVVWNITSPGWLATRDIAVYLKPAAAGVIGTYTLQGVMTPVTDPKAIKPWLDRAVALGDTTASLDDVCVNLHRLWRNPAAPEALPATLENRVSMLALRGTARPDGASALRQLGNEHPLFRFITATGWAGPLGVAAGQSATIELRERDRATGTEGAVVGRVTLTAGASDALSAPGAPVFVKPPFLTSLPVPNDQALAIPSADKWPDLAMPLRWAVPEALRRQILLTRGFRVYRLQPGYTPPGGLTPAGLAAAAPVSQKKLLTRTPATATALYRVPGSGETGADVNNFTADPDTWFIADDNGRYDFVTEVTPQNPLNITGTPYVENARWDYVVSAVDLLGRDISVSPRLTDVPACRTVPPTVPKSLRVENIMKNGAQRLRVVWRPNANAAAEVSATHYLIFRDRAKNTPGSASATIRASSPSRQEELIYLGVMNHSAGTNGELTFDDDALVPAAADFGQTYFYSIRAAHLGPCGYNCSPPSPPVFGTLRDRKGPDAPTGFVATECPRAAVFYAGASSVATPNLPPDTVSVRARIAREDRGVEAVSVRYAYVFGGAPVSPNPVPLFFGNSDEVWLDFTLPQTASRTLTVAVLAGTTARRYSHPATAIELVPPLIGSRFELIFSTKTANLTDLSPPDTGGAWAPYFTSDNTPTNFSFTPVALAGAARGTYNGSISTERRELLVQYQHTSGAWISTSVAVLPAGSQTFYFDPLSSISRPWRAWRIIEYAPNSQPDECLHDARPAQKTTVQPVQVALLMQPGSKEYRLYRKIDDGPLFLLKQDTGTWDSSVVQAVMFADNMIPPAGGRIGYYGQTFDEHGNPSPLALLDQKIGALAELPVPVLNVPASEGTAAAPKLRVKATCPRPGVQRIEILLNPPPEPTGGIVSTGSTSGQLFNFKSGSSITGPQTYSGAVAPQVAQSGNASAPYTLNTALNIKAATKYTLQVRALGADGIPGQWTAPMEFTWQEPVAAGEVPWPARPLPPVLPWSTAISAKVVTPQDFVLQVGPLRGINAGPSVVHVRIGSFYVSGPAGDDKNWNVEGVNLGDGNILGFFRYNQILGSSAVDAGNLAAFAPRVYTYRRQTMSGDIPTEDFSTQLLPVVLYRQQTGRTIEGAMQAVNGTDVIQVSPMITGIAYTSKTVGGKPFIVISDPYVVVSGQPISGGNLLINLGLIDTAPAASGGRYQYWLAHFDPAGEVNAIIPAGEVTIP